MRHGVNSWQIDALSPRKLLIKLTSNGDNEAFASARHSSPSDPRQNLSPRCRLLLLLLCLPEMETALMTSQTQPHTHTLSHTLSHTHARTVGSVCITHIIGKSHIDFNVCCRCRRCAASASAAAIAGSIVHFALATQPQLLCYRPTLLLRSPPATRLASAIHSAAA